MAEEYSVADAVTLARMEGTLNRISDRLERSAEDVRDLRERAHTHSNRIGVLEAAKILADGEKKGSEKVVKAMYAVASMSGVTLLGAIAALAKYLLAQ